MTQILRQSTAVDVLIGPFVDLTNAATAETGESPSVKLSKNGQALAAKNDVTTPVSDADGYYNCELDATDTNTVGTLILTVAASANALPVRHEFMVIEEAIYDALYAASANVFEGAAGSNAVRLVTTLTTLTGHTVQTGDSFARIGATGSGLTSLATQASVDTIDGIVDAILVDTGTTLDDLVDDLEARLGTPGNLGGGATVAQNLADMAGATFATATDSLEAIRNRGDAAWTTGGGSGLTALASGTAQSGTASTLVLAASSAFADNELNGNVINIHTGTGAGQSRVITSNTNVDDTVNVYPNWTTNPDATSQYEIVQGSLNLAAISLDGPAADNAEAFFDGTGYAGTGNTIPTVTTLTGHTAQTGDSFARIGATGSGLTSLASQASVDTIDGIVDAILVDTSTTLDDLVDDLETRLGTPGDLGTGATVAANLTDINTALGVVDGIVDAILVDTSTTLDDLVDDLETRLGTPTAADIATDIANVAAQLPAALTGAGNIKADVLAVSGDAAAADKLEALMDGSITATTTGVPTTTSLPLTSLVPDITGADNAAQLVGRLLTITSGPRAGEQTDITAWDETTTTATVTALTGAPASGVTVVIH